MKVTKYGHACLLVEEKGARLLIDPGCFSSGFEELTEVSAVLYTHMHADHYDPDNLALIRGNNLNLKILADEGTAELIGVTTPGLKIARHGDLNTLDGVAVEVIGRDHAVIHESFPKTPNVGYLIAGRLFHPGDALTSLDRELEILALPLVAPWSKVGETADYLLAVAPRIAFPIHEGVTNMPEMYLGMIGGIVKGRGIDLRPLKTGETLEA